MVMRKSLYTAIFLSFLFVVFLAVPNAYAVSPISVGVKNADFSSSTLEVGKSYYATVQSTNSGSAMYKVDYVIEYYKDGKWKEETHGTSENGGFNTTLKTSKFTISSGVSKVKVTWTIQSNSYITANPRVAEETENVKVSKAKVSLDDAEFSKDTLEVGEYYTASVVSKNSGDEDYQVKYEIEYYKDGKWKELDDGTLENPGTSKKTLTTPKFKVPDSTRMKVQWTIKENNNIDIDDGSETAYADVKGSSSKKLDDLNISPTSVTIYGFNNSDKKIKVTAEYSDDSTKDVTKSVTYTSGDEKIVKVDDGVLTSGSKEGTVYIAIKYTEGSVTKQKTCKVTVKGSSETKTLKEIVVSPDNVTITGFSKSGGNLKVTAQYSDQSTKDVTKEASYKSNNDIVSVNSSGALKSANKAGTAYIAVNYKEGNVDIQETCKVNVVEASKPAVSMTNAGFEQSVLTPGSKAKAFVETTSQGTDKFDIDYKIYYSTDGTNFSGTVTSGTLEQSGKNTEKLVTREFTVYEKYKKLKVMFTIPDDEPVAVTGDNPKESIREVILPGVSLTGAGFNAATIVPGQKVKAYVDTTNSSTSKYEIDYKIMASIDGVNFTKSVTSSTVKQNGKATEKLETREFTVYESYKKLKATFTIPQEEPVNVTGNRSVETIIEVTLPRVSITTAGFNTIQDNDKVTFKAYVETTNTSTGEYDIDYELYYSTDGVSFSKRIARSTLKQSGKAAERLETRTYTIGKDYKKIKAIFTIPDDQPVIVVGQKSMEAIMNVNGSGDGFSDLPQDHWAYTAIMEMVNRGVISGYPDGTFRPDKEVTREEFAKIMTLALRLSIQNPKNPSFVDVSRKHWAYKYIETAKPYLTGYNTNSGLKYKGTENALREDIAVALVKARCYQNDDVDINELSNMFTDSNQMSQNLKKYILIAKKRGLIDGYPDGTFKPKATLTRAEASKLLWQIITMDDEKIVIP